VPTWISSAARHVAVYLTRGTNRVGSVYAAVPLKFAAQPGDYFVNFIAQPGGTDKAGTYALAFVPALP